VHGSGWVKISFVAAYNEHQAWLHRVQMMHATHMAQSGSSSQLSPLPGAPMSWALPLESDVPSGAGGSGGIDERFGDIALSDDDCDAPVYRSLGGLFAADEDAAAGDLAFDTDELPVYRSIGLTPAAPAPPLHSGEPLTADDAERAWLESMPPLIRRQNAHGPSILVA